MSNLSEEKSNIINLFNQKKYNKVSKIYRKNKEFDLKDPEITKIAVTSEFYLKNFNQAEIYLKNILKEFNTAELNYLLGNIYKIQNKNELSIEAFKKTLNINRNFSAAYNNLANIYKKLKQHQKAILNYKEAIKTNPKNLEAYYNFANLLKDNKNYKEAIINYEKVIQINSNFQDAYNNIGTIYSILGKFDKCLEYFIKAIEINKYFAEPYKNYVQATKIRKNDKIFTILQKIVNEDDIPEDQREVFYYALSKSYLDVEQNDLAFKYLNLANEIKLKKTNFSKKIQDKEFIKIEKFFSKKLTPLNKIEQEENIKPIFILGMPRSGTTLVEQIISNHSKVFGGGELNFLPDAIESTNWVNYENLDQISKKIREKYILNLKKMSNKKFITDKLPGNFKRIGFIVNCFPEAKILHLERNPMAVCWSNYKSNFNSDGMSFTLKQEYIAEYYLLYKNLMDFWHKKYSDKIIIVNYENLVNNFRYEVKNLFLKIGLDWEENLYDFHKNTRPVETASFMQVRNKIFKNSSEQWKKYENYLKPMTDILKNNNIIF